MHFNLDFGAAFGGSFSAKAVRMWLDPFIRETLTSMLVWPNRLVVPMLPESVTGPLDDLMLRCVRLSRLPAAEQATSALLTACHVALVLVMKQRCCRDFLQ